MGDYAISWRRLITELDNVASDPSCGLSANACRSVTALFTTSLSCGTYRLLYSGSNVSLIMRTRSERGHLARVGQQDLVNLKDDLINAEVSDLAIHLHAILSVTSSKYSSDAVVDIIPEITSLLSKYDAALKVNDDLQNNLIDLSSENLLLARALESEKNLRKLNLDDSLRYGEQAEDEIASLKQTVKSLEGRLTALQSELVDKNAIIQVISSDYAELVNQKKQSSISEAPESGYVVPKHTIRPKDPSRPPPLATENRFSALLEDSTSASPCIIQTEALVHRDCSPRKLVSSTPATAPPVGTKKKRVTILSDSQGKDLHGFIRSLGEEFDVFVYTLPGAKIKHVVLRGLKFVEDFGEDDYIIVLAGSNDVGLNEPAQLTITQGINSLLSLDLKTNVLLNLIPYRFDIASLNDRISFCNGMISRMIHNYSGKLNIVCDDINLVLGRSHFTRHGLHTNRQGKRCLGSHFTNFIKNSLHRSREAQRSTAVQRETHTSISALKPCSRTPRRVVDTSLNAIELFPLESSAEAPYTASPRSLCIDSSSSLCNSPLGMVNFPPLPTPSLSFSSSAPKVNHSLLDIPFLVPPLNPHVNRSI